MDKLMKLVYFDSMNDKVYSHLFMPTSILQTGALFVAESGDIYTVEYYNEKHNVAFALRRVGEDG